MFFIPGWLISALTFPGVVVHEIAHRIFCHLSGVPVYQVRYFQFGGNPAGYVVHGKPPSIRAALLIAAGPLIVNTLLCSLLTFAAALPLFVLQDDAASSVSIFLIWVGLAIGMHAFPSNHDADEFVSLVEEHRGSSGVLATAAQLFAWLLRAANALRVIWINLFYAVAVAFALPWSLGLL